MVVDSRDLREHLRYFAELGVEGISRDPAWRTRLAASAADAGRGGSMEPLLASPAAESPAAPAAAALVQAGVLQRPPGTAPETLAVIRADIGDCTRCKLHRGRTNLVFGVGNSEAELMFVGEGPGADEDVQGEPFVGRAGQLLTKIIGAMGFERSDVYIANVVKCRPPGNRNPEADEIAQCAPFLLRQIEVVRPRAIVALGTFAAQSLLGTAEPISRLRGRFHPFGETVVMPTFHPSYLLRTPTAKREVWEDMKQVLVHLGREVPRTGS